MLRIKVKDLNLNPNGMGTLDDVDGTSYRAVEVQIHTPAEHTI